MRLCDLEWHVIDGFGAEVKEANFERADGMWIYIMYDQFGYYSIYLDYGPWGIQNTRPANKTSWASIPDAFQAQCKIYELLGE